MKRIIIGGFLAILAASGTAARADSKLRLFANGSFDLKAIEATELRTFTDWTEDAQLDLGYTFDGGPGFEIGAQYDFVKHLGVALSFAETMRNGKATVDASLPHPLYLNQPRSASTETPSLSYTEQDFYLNLVASTTSGKITFGGFAGVGFFKVKADLVLRVPYTQSYPYDSVALQTPEFASAEDTVVGFNLGVLGDYRFNRRFGAGLGARFSTAKSKLVPTEGKSMDLDLGGIQVFGGIRLYF